MPASAINRAQIILYVLMLLLTIKPLGWYMARVYQGNISSLKLLENWIYRFCLVQKDQAMDWKEYLIAMLIFNFIGFLIIYLIQRLQFFLPLNPQHFTGVSPLIAFNTAVSFVTNTNWQAYAGETTMSYLTQMLTLTVQNFLSAASGMSLLMALTRGLAGKEIKALGNFWVDMVRSVLYILLPLSIFLSIILVSQGVIQNFKPYQPVNLLQSFSYQQQAETKYINQQLIPMGPVASQVAIKQLGTNGGGFFNTNAAHPFENPNPITNFLEMLSILLIPAALCYTFGIMINDKRQGLAILSAMLIIFIPLSFGAVTAEQYGNPNFISMGISSIENMEGKEARFGTASSALWSTATTAAANGSVNSMQDSFSPLGGLAPLWLMHLGEVIFGGVGSGLSGMIMLIIIAVFVSGLMVGRTPEYLGKKIEPYEMKMAAVAVLIMPLFVLVFTAIAAVTVMGTSAIKNPGPHGFTEMLYAFTSMVNNNGSALTGLNTTSSFYTLLGGIGMLLGRYWIAIPTLAIAGSLAQKKIIPVNQGTLATHTPLFILLLVGVTIILGALTFFPELALGPIVEHLLLWNPHG